LDKTDKLLLEAISRLKQSNIGVTIFKPGQKLSLRAMLPPKPGSNAKKPSQQTISLGIYCNSAGIKIAEKLAQKLASSLALSDFDWNDWVNSPKGESFESVKYWLDRFEKDYFNRKQRNDRTLTTWNGDYLSMFKRLPIDEKLTTEILTDISCFCSSGVSINKILY
jgi:hypothetical protein